MVLLAAIIAVSQAVVLPGGGLLAAPAYGAYPGLGYPAVAKVSNCILSSLFVSQLFNLLRILYCRVKLNSNGFLQCACSMRY